MTEWPVTIDRRYHDAVILDLDCVVIEPEKGQLQAFDSAVPFLRRLRDGGIATAVYSSTRDCAETLRAAGFDGLASITVDNGVAIGEPSVLTRATSQLGISPGRCVLIACEPAAVRAGGDAGFSLVIGLARNGRADDLLSSGADTVIAGLAEISVRSGDAAMSTIADALQVYTQLKELVAGRRPAVFLDFDGTLSDIVEQPESATPVEGADEALRALAAQCPVAVISGRDLSDIRQRVKVDGLWYAGSHGFELVAPDGSHHENAAADVVDTLERAATRLAETLSDVSGILVEHKRFAVAVHYRNTDPADVDHVVATVRNIGRALGLRVTTGRKVIELRPDVDWDKGSTLNWLLDQVGGTEPANSGAVLPIYLGDDISDEDAFDAIQFDGVGIVVRHREHGDRPSAAQFSLESPATACVFIRQLADDLERAATAPSDPWELVYEGYDPNSERLREALCTVGNGYVATRGCAPEAAASEAHYPGTYASGVYNTLSDRVAGRTIENESLVNLPNWLSLTFRINGGPWFHVDDVELLFYRQTFDLRHATLTRTLRFRDGAGQVTALTQQRFASMHEPHVLALQTTIVAENWSGTVEFRSLLDGGVQNTMVERYRSLSSTHLAPAAIDEVTPDAVILRTETSQSRIAIAVGARSTVWCDGALADARYTIVQEDNRGGHDIQVALSDGQSVTCEKVAMIFTGRDPAISEPASAAQRYLDGAGRYEELHAEHARAWARLWEQCHVGLADNTDALRVLRLHLVHVLQTLSPHTAELDAGVPARGLHGEAYRGHVFWDSLFVSPVLSIRMPNVARSLLLYRYRRLPEARRAARAAGYLGAMYPWQSGSDGCEVSQELHLNPESGRWNPDASARAHHVGLAIAYNAWQHYQVTGDRQFLVDYGAEMLVEIARFWVGLASFDDSRGRYMIRGIIGPDEFHSGYPGKEYDGIDNNAYTNVMAVWVILRAMDTLRLLPLRDRLDLVGKVDLTAEELQRWDRVTRRMFVPFHDDVISQFEGYSELAELDWDQYRQRYGNIQRLDRILEAENDSVNNYKASKQADVLMLFYLLSSEELLGLFGRLGYRFAPEQIPKTIDYYLARTSDGSTLSSLVHSWVIARAHRHHAMKYFVQVLASDIVDIQGGTTSEGIHLAAMAGSVDVLQRCFTGLETRDDRLILNPQWPKSLGPIGFAFVYRGQRVHLRISGRAGRLTSEAGNTGPVLVECRGRVQQLQPGRTIEVA
ncbi:trehalose-phosphatase [Mycobacterium sp. 663a-19]|uniref:trehalose-phosphatase n=1 Tax=Mycobacterium sp. 663a-19 TaxID=2986148 RepID=UPI002D1EB978|nr:trehalose-phosphatase [Mycobacterium sp. 663a-19]MEB3981533.1 trehalose-phosphatase [Mycobacterium sp. 663a-19]